MFTCNIRLWLFLLLLPDLLRAQIPNFKFKHITNEQGLSQSTTEIIFQDSKGFMWFGTTDGLNRYDGHQIVVYKKLPGQNTSLSDNIIHAIYEDYQHNLWIGTSNGLNRFNPVLNNFTRFSHHNKYTDINGDHITGIKEDDKHRLWVSTNWGGLSLVDPATNHFKDFYPDVKQGAPVLDHSVNCIFNGHDGKLWIGTWNGLQIFDPEKERFLHLTPFYSQFTQNIITIQADKTGHIWLGTDPAGLMMIDQKQLKIKVFKHDDKVASSLGSNRIISMLSTRTGKLYIGTVNGGLNLFDPKDQAFTRYVNDPTNPSSLSQITISAIYEDNQENLWIGTHRGGINLYSPGDQKFSLFRKSNAENSLSYNDVKSFCEDSNGNIWIGTDGGGLNHFERNTGSFKHYRFNAYNTKSIGSDEVMSIMEDHDGKIWIGTFDGGLNLFNPQHGTFKRYLNDPLNNHSISSNLVMQVFEDHLNNLWVCTYLGGLNLFDRKTQTFKRFGQGNTPETQLLGNKVMSMREDQDGNLWIATEDAGLNFYNGKTGKFKHYLNNARNTDLVFTFIDSYKRIWVAKKGLYLFDPKSQNFNLYTTKAGLSTEYIKGITEGKPGELWISTSNGLTRFNTVDQTFKKFNSNDGLQGLEFESNAYMKSKSGEMYFGGVNGFNKFFPDSIRLNKFIPPVYITGFQIFNKQVVPGRQSPLKTDIVITRDVALNYKQSSIAFDFAALNYNSADNNLYAYKLEPFDKDWNYVNTEHKASYTNLDPGKYIFHVKASNNDGVWNNTGAVLNISINPPFWATWWFRLLAFCLFIFGVYSFYEFRKKRAVKNLEEQKREELHQIQLQFFTNISHEFRTPLTLILGPVESLKQDDTRPAYLPYYNIIQRNALRLLGLINELMDFRKVNAGVLKLKVKPNYSTDFLREIGSEFSSLAIEKRISFEIQSAPDQRELWFDRNIIEKIVFNLLNNSFKYTMESGRITLSIFYSIMEFTPSFENELVIKNKFSATDHFFIHVADSGIGISKDTIKHLFERYYRINDAHLGSGIGLAFVKSLTDLHKGDIFVYSEKLKGTEIIIAIPLSKNNYHKDELWDQDEPGTVLLESVLHKSDLMKGTVQPSLLKDNNPALPKTQEEHILIVDDNAELRNYLHAALDKHYVISEAENGRDGVTMAREVFPDLIISDVLMPDMNGLEFCTIIKNDIDTSHIPFMMLTAKDAMESRIEGVNSGADIYFSKPFSLELLLLTIRNVFEQQHKLKTYYARDYYAEAKELVHSTKDREFIDNLVTILEKHLTNTDLDIDLIAQEIGMSHSKLYQKIRKITGQSIIEFIRSFRLKKAVQILTHEDVNINEVMYRIGIQTQSYFTKSFKKEFGKTPTQFLQEIKKSG